MWGVSIAPAAFDRHGDTLEVIIYKHVKFAVETNGSRLRLIGCEEDIVINVVVIAVPD